MSKRTTMVLRTALLCGACAGVMVASCKVGGRRGGGGGGGGGTPPIADPSDFRSFPPVIEAATVEMLEKPEADGNARLEVAFDPADARTRKGVSIMHEGREVRLRDDGSAGDARGGDGVFSALTTFDFEQALAANKAELRSLEGRAPRAIFRGREIIGVEDAKAAALRVRDFPRSIEAFRGKKIDLFGLGSTVDPMSISPERSLVITDTSVVQDPNRTWSLCPTDPNGPGKGNPNGVWTFKHLMTEMANQAATGVDPAVFTEAWLKLWLTTQTVSSGFTVPARGAMLTRVLANWPRVGGKLDLDQSPFRLAAIVNRIDLAQNLVYGGGSAGEGRFVFGVFNNQTGTPCDMLSRFSVIFEYGISKKNCSELKAWANQWVALGSIALNDPVFNPALEAITKQFTEANTAPGKPNGSSINQVRTNEIDLGSPWELREFKVHKGTHMLFEDTTKQTPDSTLNGSVAVAKFVNSNEAAVLLDKHVVPDRFPGGAAFMGGSSIASIGFFAGTGITNGEARHHFSLNTCVACHTNETSTVFLHVDPSSMPAGLSRFMTGASASITDSPDPFPVTNPEPGPSHDFNDLDRRRGVLAKIAGSACIRRIGVPKALREFQIRPRLDPREPRPSIGDPRIDGTLDTITMTH